MGIVELKFLNAWMPTIKKHNNRKTVQHWTAKGTATRQNNGMMEMHWSITVNLHDINGPM